MYKFKGKKLSSCYLSLCIIKGQALEDERILRFMGQRRIYINLFTVALKTIQRKFHFNQCKQLQVTQDAFILDTCQSLLNIILFHFTFQLDVNKYLLNI